MSAPATLLKTSFGQAQIFRSYTDISEEIWRKYFGDHWKNHAFLQIVEETLREDFDYFHLLLTDVAGNIVGLQPGFVTRQDLALGLPGFLRMVVGQVRRLAKNFLHPQMAFLGSSAANGRLGGTTLVNFVAEAALIYARSRGISLLTFKEFPISERNAFAEIGRLGFTAIASYPGVVMDLDCKNFDDYLATKVGKATRKGLRRKFRSLDDHPPIRMECVTSITPHLPRIYELYLQVYERAEEKFEKLTPDFFAAVAEKLTDRARFFLWWQADKLIAFSLCFVHDGIFYDDYIGFDDSVAHDLHLYYVTFRDQLEWAIGQGLHTYYSTPMSYEPKLRLGFRLVPLDLYVCHTSPLFNGIYARLAAVFAPTANDPTLPLFPNFTDLKPLQK